MNSHKPYIFGLIGVRDYKNVLYNNKAYVVRTLEDHIRKAGYPLLSENIAILTGGGKGIEMMGAEWANSKNIPCTIIPPNIESLGVKNAFVMRNTHIISECDELLVFWDGYMDTTAQTFPMAMHLKKKVTIYPLM